MTILLVTSKEEESGGVASVIGNLARYLHSRGHEIIFLYAGDSISPKKVKTKMGFTGFELNLRVPFREGRHPVITLAAFLICFPISMYKLIWFIKKNKIQIVNIHYPAEFFFYFALCRRILPLVLVTSVHGAELFPGGSPMAKYSPGIRLLLASSDRIVAPSRSFQNDVCGIFPHLKEKTTFIHNSVDLTELNGASPHISSHDRDPYILCIAMHNEKKGLDMLLRAFKHVQHAQPSIKLVLVGDGPLRKQLEHLASSLEIRDRVKFLGLQGRIEVRQLLHDCELFVLPSRSEPFGIAIIEAMACKKPVVATSVGGIPEIIEHQKNGILVEPDNPDALAEALVTVLKDPTLQRVIAKNGFDTVQKQFGSANSGTAYEKVFTDLLNSADRRAA
jgi:glycosyltransferase involved in cell wall biosynthesis